MSVYANVRPNPADPVRSGPIVNLDVAPTLGWENIRLEDADHLRRLVSEHRASAINFHSTAYPQRPVAVDKADKWVAKVGRELERGRS